MGLKEYHHKRDFSRTNEPYGESSVPKEKFHRFFIQKHKASHLHYDFRLEIDGVLKSWAVPKGPSLNPADKRLAMMVEDHPLDYGTFEGVIPEGNYGAGTVLLWDEGFFAVPGVEDFQETEQELRKMLYKGDLKLLLMGSKIKGEFALVRSKKKDGKGNEWLLIKKNDEFATEKVITDDEKSVSSGLNLEEVKQKATEDAIFWYSPSNKNIDYRGTPMAEMPRNVKPMLASLTSEPFNNKDYVFEIKWDGYRAIGEVNYTTVSLYSRNGLSFNADYPLIVDRLKKVGYKAVFDGEIVVVDEKMRSDFSLIQNYKRTGRGQLIYYIFDILYLNGHDLTKLPLIERKEVLRSILPDDPVLRYSDHVIGEGVPFYNKASEIRLEGIIAKKKSSQYLLGKRSREWLKVKILKHQEAVIAGFTEPRKGRNKFGALVLGVYESGKLSYIGHSGTGFDQKSLEEVYNKLKPLVRTTSPFVEPPKTNMPVKWVEPRLVCQVKFQEWTKDGIMRQPVFLGLRSDKLAGDVIREVTENSSSNLKEEEAGRHMKMRQPVSKRKTNKGTLKGKSSLIRDDSLTNNKQEAIIEIGNVYLKFTNLDKIYWPEEGYTKRDLLEYYDRISDFILPYLFNRPESLKRHPNGIREKAFFQKNMPESIPEWVKTVRIYSESNDSDINYLICNDKATLLYMANLGCIEINPWSSRIENLDRPDFTVIDLDPGKNATFENVVEVSLAVKEVLDRAGIKGYPKTSGSRGVHIYIPLDSKYAYDQVKDFTYLLATMVNNLVPKLTSLERIPSKRMGPVYLDYLQNRKGQTLAAPYCVRPRRGATVSTPVTWKELMNNQVLPENFTIKTIFERLEVVGDLFSPVIGKGASIENALSKLSS